MDIAIQELAITNSAFFKSTIIGQLTPVYFNKYIYILFFYPNSYRSPLNIFTPF